MSNIDFSNNNTNKNNTNKKQDDLDYLVKSSFTITYALLLTTATITLIESLRTPDSKIRHVLNLETCISIVAGYFYSIFIQKINDSHGNINWNDINKSRYIDWYITTPMMLLSLCIVLSMNSKIKITLSTILIIITLNYFMLYSGYLGEIKQINKITATILGFIAFFLMFFVIFNVFLKSKFILDNYILFSCYLIIWSVYGIAYLMEEQYKNIIMNILDCTAKCLLGIGLWLYFTKTIVL